MVEDNSLMALFLFYVLVVLSFAFLGGIKTKIFNKRVKKMNEQEALALMQSDMSLWEKATTVELGDGRQEKTIEGWPWGIGTITVTLEGLTDGVKRREAVGQFGEYIRAVVDERINDEAITLRAQQAAAHNKQADSGDSMAVDTHRVPEPADEAAPLPAASPAHEGDAEGATDFGASLVARKSALLNEIGRAEDNLARWRRELAGIEAALAVMEQ
jgi:hypothetical protein